MPCVEKGGEEKESRGGGLRKETNALDPLLSPFRFTNTLVPIFFIFFYFPSLELYQTVRTVISTGVFRGRISGARVFYELKRQLSCALDLKHTSYIVAHKDLLSGQLQEFG